MNPLFFEIAAGKAINHWTTHHSEGCALVLNGNSVLAVSHSKTPANHSKSLRLSPSQCRSGLTGSHWTLVGRALQSLYERQHPCPKHPKR